MDKKRQSIYPPSKVLILKDGLQHLGYLYDESIGIIVEEIQLPFLEVNDALMGYCGRVVVYDVRELLRDIDRLKEMVEGIVECCSVPITRGKGAPHE